MQNLGTGLSTYFSTQSLVTTSATATHSFQSKDQQHLSHSLFVSHFVQSPTASVPFQTTELRKLMSTTVSNEMSCCLVEFYWRFGKEYSLRLQYRRVNQAAKLVRSWRCTQYVLPKRLYISIRLHDVLSEKMPYKATLIFPMRKSYIYYKIEYLI
jgi:hypothetical protein